MDYVTESDASVYVKTRIADRFNFGLTVSQISDWVRAVRLCHDLGEAERIVRQLVDHGNLTIPGFRALLAAAHPYRPPPTPIPTDAVSCRGMVADLRARIVERLGVKAEQVFGDVDRVRVSLPGQWRPLTESAVASRRAALLAQLRGSPALSAQKPRSAIPLNGYQGKGDAEIVDPGATSQADVTISQDAEAWWLDRSDLAGQGQADMAGEAVCGQAAPADVDPGTPTPPATPQGDDDVGVPLSDICVAGDFRDSSHS